MNITPFDNSFKLCEHWLSNAKNNILNKEILNLQISSYGDTKHSFEILKNLNYEDNKINKVFFAFQCLKDLTFWSRISSLKTIFCFLF